MMQETEIPQVLDSILYELDLVFRKVHDQVAQFSVASYVSKPDSSWSVAEQLEHLILAIGPVARSLGKDMDWFDQFGKPQHQDKDYNDLKVYYYEVLKTGMKAPPRSTPDEAKVYDKKEQLALWRSISKKLIREAENWTEEALDQKALPHPALGLINIRQILFFTIFHTYHHLKFIRL